MSCIEERFEKWWSGHYKPWRKKREAVKEEYKRAFLDGAKMVYEKMNPIIKILKGLVGEKVPNA